MIPRYLPEDILPLKNVFTVSLSVGVTGAAPGVLIEVVLVGSGEGSLNPLVIVATASGMVVIRVVGRANSFVVRDEVLVFSVVDDEICSGSAGG